MSAADLTPFLLLLTVCAWTSFGLFVWAAFDGPWIASLGERTYIAFILACLGTVASILRYNTDTGYSLMPQSTASLLFVVTMLAVLTIPTIWLVVISGLWIKRWRK